MSALVKPALGAETFTADGFRIDAVNGGRYVIVPPSGWVDDLGNVYGTRGTRRDYVITGWDRAVTMIERIRTWNSSEVTS